MSGSPASARPLSWPAFVFVLALMLHAWLVTRNWSAGFLAGHEFRQTQTALSTHFIRVEDNYSLAYPTPVLGKPWSIPMEFPLYQWTVARLADATGWSLAEAGRTVTLACFYLTLPALFLLLGSAGLARAVRWCALAAVVTAPVYIFYSRAFLIESLALMGGVWFVAATVRFATGRNAWLPPALLAGVIVALVKVTTAMVWLGLTGIWCVILAGRAWRSSGLSQHPEGSFAILARGALCALPAMAAGAWWVHTSDAIKALSPGGATLMATELAGNNFGNAHDRLSAEAIGQLVHNWNTALGVWWLWLPLVAAGWWAGRRSVWILPAAAAAFLVVLAVFPRLYRWHDYYFYASAILPLVAAGVAAASFTAPRWPRWLSPLLLAVVVSSQLLSYVRHYAPLQLVASNGGSGLTDALRDLVPSDSVILVAGADWAPVIPYYSRHRALMIRSHQEEDDTYLDAAFANLRGEDVAALVVMQGPAVSLRFIERAVEAFELVPGAGIQHSTGAVYFSRRYHDNLLGRLLSGSTYDGVVVTGQLLEPAPGPAPDIQADGQIHAVLSGQAAWFFPGFDPVPHRYRSQFGFGPNQLEGRTVTGAHPTASVWIRPPAGATRLELDFGLPPETYERDGEKTDGVVFHVRVRRTDDRAEEIWSRHLDPADRAEDRGPQTVGLALPTGVTEIEIATSAGGSLAYDWAYWSRLAVK